MCVGIGISLWKMAVLIGTPIAFLLTVTQDDELELRKRIDSAEIFGRYNEAEYFKKKLLKYK